MSNSSSEGRYSSRPLTLDDAERCAEIATAVAADHGIAQQYQAHSFLTEWQDPDFDLSQASIGIVSDCGQLVAFASFLATAETPVHPWLNWDVHPDHRGHGLSRQLLRWADTQGEAVIPRCPPDSRVSIFSGSRKGYQYVEEAMQSAGYSPVRASYDMRITMTERPVAPDLPAGFSARPYTHEDDLPLLVEITRDSFSDHFGYIEEPFEKELAFFRHWLNNDPYFDPELVMLAIDEESGVVAGCLMGLTQDAREPDVGYIDIVGVRRDYRRRGLASALLRRSFAMYWDRGKLEVGLDVDGASLTNAVAVYERAGMHLHREFVEYEKVLRDGVELAKVALE